MPGNARRSSEVCGDDGGGCAGITVNHRPGWEQGKGDKTHMCWFYDTADLNFFGRHEPFTKANAGNERVSRILLLFVTTFPSDYLCGSGRTGVLHL